VVQEPKPVRVLIANSPRLIRELIIETISDEPDIEIVGEVKNELELPAAVNRTAPDFVIVALEKHNRLPLVCNAILREHPGLKIIAIAPDRNSSMFYWTSLRVQSNRIEASEAGVLDALRGKRRVPERLQ
jgi:AmiR/NasT family two-component response regulator